MSVKKVSRLEDRRKFASWFDKNLAVSLSKDTCKNCSLTQFVENTRDLYDLKDVVTGNEENIVLAKQKKMLAEKKAKEVSTMKAQVNDQEQSKIAEVVSDTKNESVSSNLPAAQKEVRKFDGMLGSVRVVMRENKPWFVAKDVAACIEHKDVSTMCKLCREKDVLTINGKEYSAELAEYSESRGNPNIRVISESGLYRILAKSSLPKCEPFESWVFDEVLPSIRQTGSYSVTTPALPDFTNPAEAARAWATEYEQRVTAQKALSAEQDAHNETRLALTAETEKNEALVQQNNYMAKVENSALATASRLSNDNKRLSHDIYLNEMYITQAMSDGMNYHVERNRMFRSVYEFVTQSTTSARIFKQDVFKNVYIRNSLLNKIDNEMLDVFVKYISRAVANGISESFIRDVFKIVRKSWDKKEIPNMGKRSPEEVQIVLNAIYEYVQEQKDGVATSNFKDRWAPPKYSLVIWSQWFRYYFKSLANCSELHDYLNVQTLNALRDETFKEEGYDIPRFVMDECAKNFGFFVTMP
jgi:prophage antirepressor-like protein